MYFLLDECLSTRCRAWNVESKSLFRPLHSLLESILPFQFLSHFMLADSNPWKLINSSMLVIAWSFLCFYNTSEYVNAFFGFLLPNLKKKNLLLYFTIDVGRSSHMKIHFGVVQQPFMQCKHFSLAYSHLTSTLFSAQEKACNQNCHVSWKLEMEEHRLLVAGARPHDRWLYF